MCRCEPVSELAVDRIADPRQNGTGPKETRMLNDVNKIQFGLGLLVVLVAASLSLLDVLGFGAAIGAFALSGALAIPT